MKSMKSEPQPPEFQRFDANMEKLLALPREVFQKRLKEFKERPGTRGPKRKVKLSRFPRPCRLVDGFRYHAS
jgi:hypothetical protein